MAVNEQNNEGANWRKALEDHTFEITAGDWSTMDQKLENQRIQNQGGTMMRYFLVGLGIGAVLMLLYGLSLIFGANKTAPDTKALNPVNIESVTPQEAQPTSEEILSAPAVAEEAKVNNPNASNRMVVKERVTLIDFSTFNEADYTPGLMAPSLLKKPIKPITTEEQPVMPEVKQPLELPVDTEE